MNQATFLKLERQKMQKAIARCKLVHPKARRTSRTTVQVSGSRGNTYTVTLAQPKPGLALAFCNCEAGKAGQYCFHLAAAAVVPGTVITEQAGQPAAPAQPMYKGNYRNECKVCGNLWLSNVPSDYCVLHEEENPARWRPSRRQIERAQPKSQPRATKVSEGVLVAPSLKMKAETYNGMEV